MIGLLQERKSRVHYITFPDCADLIGRILQPSEEERITMDQLIRHPWMEDDLGPLRWQVAVVLTPETVNRDAAAYVADKYRLSAADVAAAVKGRQVSAVTATYHLLDKKLRRYRGVLHSPGVYAWTRDCSATQQVVNDDKNTEAVSENNSHLFPAISSSASSPRSGTESQKATDLLRPLPMAKQNLNVSHSCGTRDYKDCLSQLKQTRTEPPQGKDTPAGEEAIAARATHSAGSQEIRAQGKSVTFSFNSDKLAKANLTPRELHILTDRFAVVHSAGRRCNDWVYSSADHPICVEGIPRLRSFARPRTPPPAPPNSAAGERRPPADYRYDVV